MTPPRTVRLVASSSPGDLPTDDVVTAIAAANQTVRMPSALLASSQVLVSTRRAESLVTTARVEWLVARPL